MPDSIDPHTTDITIQGLTFPYEHRYAEGHICNEAEAQALDVTTSENLRNNFARHIKSICADLEIENARELPLPVQKRLLMDFQTYCNTYHIGVRRVARIDPTEMMARKLAREAILSKLRSLGIDAKAKSPDWLLAQIDKALADNTWFAEEASRRISAAREAAAQVVNLEV